ncbi:MAG TPA: hypothetical protein VJ717_07285 [Gemmatimonadaceae bacterium]|nr:hypothetical protein [Gemmatimonadaceae bacterium]
MPNQVFILSPARLDGERGKLLFRREATFPLAQALGRPEGAPLGEVFSFLSGLYFRGKLAYATAFARSPEGVPPVLIITTRRGLVAPEARVSRTDLKSFSRVDIGDGDSRFRRPLRAHAKALNESISPDSQIVLLGSIATGKYVDPLLKVFGERLVFPIDFVGRGDMSRGGLMLRCVTAKRELQYVPVIRAVRHGARPPKLAPLRRGTATGNTIRIDQI